MAVFEEHIINAEKFMAKAKRLRGEPGYTVGYGAYMLEDKNKTKEDKLRSWNDSYTLNRLINDAKGNPANITLTEEEALTILKEIVIVKRDFLGKRLPILQYLDRPVQKAIFDFSYNMGVEKLLTFQEFNKNLFNGNMREAGWEVLNSNYRTQVHGRSLYNALIIATGRADLDLDYYKDEVWTKEKWEQKSLSELKEAYYAEVDRLIEQAKEANKTK